MEFAFIIWAIGTLPKVSATMCFLLFVVLFMSSACYVISSISLAVDHNTEDAAKTLQCFKKIGRNFAAVSGILWFIFLIVPNKETAYAMAAGYGVQSVVENERAQKIAGQGVDVLETFLEKTKKELEKEAPPAK